MKRYLLLALAAFSFLMVAPSAMAVRVRVVDAPTVDCTAIPANTICAVTDANASYAMSFLPVSNALCQSATGVPADISGFTWCIIFNNLSRAPRTSLDFSFTVPTQASGDDYSSVICDGVPSSVTKTFCPLGPVEAGNTISTLFSASPGVPNGESVYLFVDFQNSPGTTVATFAPVSVPEPGALGLFGLGLLGIGLGYGWKKRCQTPRGIGSAA
jgi:hypothetical protein